MGAGAALVYGVFAIFMIGGGIAAGVPLDTPGSTNLLKVEVVGRKK